MPTSERDDPHGDLYRDGMNHEPESADDIALRRVAGMRSAPERVLTVRSAPPSDYGRPATTGTTRPDAASGAVPASNRAEERRLLGRSLKSQLSSRSALVRAVVLAEILGPPKSLRGEQDER